MNKEPNDTKQTQWKTRLSCLWRKPFKWCGRKTVAPLFILYACISAYLCLFVAMPHAGAVVVKPHAAAISGSSAAHAGPDIVVPPCKIVPILIIISGSGIIMLMLFYIVCYTASAGSSGSQGPIISGFGGGGGSFIKPEDSDGLPNVNPNVNEPATVYYLQNDLIVSNSAGLPNNNSLPPLISLDGHAIPYGAELDMPQPGITTPPSIAIWDETNQYADPILDPSYNYVAVENFSVLTTSNLATGWTELYTVIAWCNDDPQTPLTTTVYYTNGVAMATNWMQMFGGTQPTNVVVYGNIPQFQMSPYLYETNYPGTNNGGGGLIPPGSGGNGTNAIVTGTQSQFFRLTATTNYLATQWPYTNN